MTNGIPFISVAGCPEWVPLTVMPHAIDHIRSQPRPNPSEPIHMLLVVGRPKHGDLSLDKGVLASLRDLEHLFAEPATPLVPANRLERPGHRPISYLLVIKPLKQE
uniref:Uncharacterized protein n=1 Tax=Lotharella globosa TaxID=91324 RepID=A0A7S4DZB2_9EUKA